MIYRKEKDEGKGTKYEAWTTKYTDTSEKNTSEKHLNRNSELEQENFSFR